MWAIFHPLVSLVKICQSQTASEDGLLPCQQQESLVEKCIGKYLLYKNNGNRVPILKKKQMQLNSMHEKNNCGTTKFSMFWLSKD